MYYFREIKKTKHYKQFHEEEAPWHMVVPVILKTKDKRKIGNKIEIKNEKYYILCELKNKILWVINAKKRR